jgi:hypothetical protein
MDKSAVINEANMTHNQLAFFNDMKLLAYPPNFIPEQNDIATWQFVDRLPDHSKTWMIRALKEENLNLRQSLAIHGAALQTAVDALGDV